MLSFVFPGQGAQVRGMGETLFDRHAELVRVSDEILGYSVKSLCLQSSDKLRDTRYTQPVLFVVNALHLRDVTSRLGLTPAVVLGHSLGEFNALVAAGSLSFVEGLRIVARRGELMAAPDKDGSMAAIINCNRAELERAIAEIGPDVCMANDNSPRQVVVSGSIPALRSLEKYARARPLGDYIPLTVSGPFHSRLMSRAAAAFREFLSDVKFLQPRIPLVLNRTAELAEIKSLRENLSAQLTSPVRWRESIVHLLRQGPVLFKQIGPGHTLIDLIRESVVEPG